YYDNLLNLRQTQKRIPSDDLVIVKQDVLDFKGRPTLQTLPVPIRSIDGVTPVISNSSIIYRPLMLPFNNSPYSYYDATNFDVNFGVPEIINTGKMNEYYDGDGDLGYNFSASKYNI